MTVAFSESANRSDHYHRQQRGRSALDDHQSSSSTSSSSSPASATPPDPAHWLGNARIRDHDSVAPIPRDYGDMMEPSRFHTPPPLSPPPLLRISAVTRPKLHTPMTNEARHQTFVMFWRQPSLQDLALSDFVLRSSFPPSSPISMKKC